MVQHEGDAADQQDPTTITVTKGQKLRFDMPPDEERLVSAPVPNQGIDMQRSSTPPVPTKCMPSVEPATMPGTGSSLHDYDMAMLYELVRRAIVVVEQRMRAHEGISLQRALLYLAGAGRKVASHLVEAEYKVSLSPIRAWSAASAS